MKLSLPALFVFCLILTSCSNTPKEDRQATTSGPDSIYNDEGFYLHSILLKEPVIIKATHRFSDNAAMDSFVAELPAGNAVGGFCFIKIYDHNKNLLFLDSASTSSYYNTDLKEETEALTDLKRGIAAIFDESNFSLSGQQDAIKNASADQIKNMAAWNEALNDSTRVLFNYLSFGSSDYVTYSQKLKKGVVALQVFTEDVD